MTAATFSLNPVALANAFDNAVNVGTDKKGLEYNDLVALTLVDGHVLIYGRGKYMAGRTSVPIEGEATTPSAVAIITEDEAAELSSALKNMDGARRKDSLVVCEVDGGLRIRSGDDVACDLADADPQRQSAGMWAWFDGMVAKAETAEGRQPLAFGSDMLVKINKTKGDASVVDLVCIEGDCVAFKKGSTFVGLAMSIGREGYAAGGKFLDGPGRPEHLWGGGAA